MADGDSSSSAASTGVDLTVRCALQSFDDLTVHAAMDWTVKDLKTHLFNTVASKPEVKRQRLIYAGHCLQDHQTIRELLDKSREGIEPGQELGPQVIHLVCAPNEPPAMQNNGLRHRANAATANAGASSTATTVPTAGGNAQDYYAQWSLPTYSLPPNATAEQIAYYNYYIQYQQAMMSWYMYTYGSVASPNVFQIQYHTPGAQNFIPGYADVAAPGGNENLVPEAAPAPPVAQNNNIAPHRHDILGILYKSIRLGFFLMVLFMYSSIERFLVVFLIVCLLWYVHRRREQDNFRAAARRSMEQAARDFRNNHPAAQAAAGAGGAVANDNNNNEVPAEPAAPAAAAPPQVEVQTPWTLFWSTVSSFFLSLIPENPVPPVGMGAE
uniref:Ubiquitin-like domain-containing protein n=1 Tax=Panagrellus redivivus TaxID=6233 RepID=A0A7E4VVB0_PANRE